MQKIIFMVLISIAAIGCFSISGQCEKMWAKANGNGPAPTPAKKVMKNGVPAGKCETCGTTSNTKP